MITLRRAFAPALVSLQGTTRLRDLEHRALALPEGIAFRLLEGAAFRRIFSPRRDTLESDALRVVEKAALNVLDWIDARSAG